MTTPEMTSTSGSSRKFRNLTIGIVVFIAVYSGIWFLAAHQIQTRLAELFTTLPGGRTAQCDDMTVRGFPFRIGLFCDAVRIDDTAQGASGTFGALRSAAQVYWPGHAVAELDGPAEIRVSPGLSISADWSLLQASVQAGLSGLNRTSLAYDNMRGTAVVPIMSDDIDMPAPRFAFAITHGETHLRQNGTDLDAAISMDGLDLKPDKGSSLLPPLKVDAGLTFADRGEMMQSGLHSEALRGSRGELHNITLDFGNGSVATASGPFTISERGLISGEISVTMKNIESWRQNLLKVFTDEDDTVMVNNIANMLKALSDGKNEASVKLNIRDGVAFLAFFPIGELPPV